MVRGLIFKSSDDQETNICIFPIPVEFGQSKFEKTSSQEPKVENEKSTRTEKWRKRERSTQKILRIYFDSRILHHYSCLTTTEVIDIHMLGVLIDKE